MSILLRLYNASYTLLATLRPTALYYAFLLCHYAGTLILRVLACAMLVYSVPVCVKDRRRVPERVPSTRLAVPGSVQDSVPVPNLTPLHTAYDVQQQASNNNAALGPLPRRKIGIVFDHLEPTKLKLQASLVPPWPSLEWRLQPPSQHCRLNITHKQATAVLPSPSRPCIYCLRPQN